MASRYGNRSNIPTEEVQELVLADTHSQLSELDSAFSDEEEMDSVLSLMEDSGDDTVDSEGNGKEMEIGEAPHASRQQRQLVWEDVTLYDDLDETWIPPIQQRRGVLVPTENFHPVDYFKLFFPGDLFDLIAEQTNIFAEQFLDNASDLSRHSRFLN